MWIDFSFNFNRSNPTVNTDGYRRLEWIAKMKIRNGQIFPSSIFEYKNGMEIVDINNI